MHRCFSKGDKKEFTRLVSEADTAFFDAGQVHNVLSTFALGRDAEWVCRLFVIDMKEDPEEGIGTFLEIEHHSPAFVGQLVTYSGIFDEQRGNTVICSFSAYVGPRLIAKGRTGQKIVKQEKLNQLFNTLRDQSI